MSDDEKTSIRIYKEIGFFNRQTAQKIGRSETVIRNVLKKGSKYGQKKPTLGNTKLNSRQRGQIRLEATKNRLNAKQIKQKLDLPVTKQHVAHVLRHSDYIKYKKTKEKPHLTKTHKVS